MLARTYGQPAVPTTFGKEIAVFYMRLKKQYAQLESHHFEAKLTGAVGNFNALLSSAPQITWSKFSQKFIQNFGWNQIWLPLKFFPMITGSNISTHCIWFNSILIDFAQDMWRYISDDDLKLKVVASEVGSSTMPQKVNPIDFENAEGNLGVANALLEHYARKLPISAL